MAHDHRHGQAGPTNPIVRREPDGLDASVLDALHAAGTVVADRDAAALLDGLPTGVILIGPDATVRYANRRVRDLFGWGVADLVGRSMLDVVLPEDLGYAAGLLTEASGFYGSVLGPLRLRFVDAAGAVGFTECWARELDDHSGYVIVAPSSSVVDLIGDAVQAIATGQPIERAVDLIVSGFSAYPMSGGATLLRVVDGDLRPMTAWPIDDRWWRDVTDAPWHLAARTGSAVDVNDLTELGELGDALAEVGCRALWCRPVIGRRGEVSAVIVVSRPFSRPPTTNQQARMRQLVNVAALAFDQLEYRSALERAAFTDHLTGAATRARLRQELEHGLVWTALLYLDLDGFKEINDAHGHHAGDAVLAEVGMRLLASVRADDLVVRLGGDEFLLVASDATERDAVEIARRVITAIEAPTVVVDRDGTTTVSVGASVGVCARVGAMTFDDAMRLADQALVDAKQAGKRRFLLASAGS